jgi:signal peptidase II
VKQKLLVFLGIFPAVIVLDLITKNWALVTLDGGRRMELFFGYVPLTLAFNRGAAFGLSVGNDPRWFFIPITMLALILLLVLLRQAGPRDQLRFVSISLVISGALGNLYDRLRWDRGVVDFIGPIDLGVMLWPIFNVADMAISCGAVLLAISFWREERRAGSAAASADDSSSHAEDSAPPTGDSTTAPEPSV